MKKTKIFILAFLVCGVLSATAAEKIYYGNEVPKGWNGSWPAKFLIPVEKTKFERTTSYYEIVEFINMLKWNSENVSVINMFTSGSRSKIGYAVVMANPRVTTPEEAKASGKPVVYIEGNIHPGESDTKEALLMLMRDILFGKKKYLLDDLIIICCPCLDVDGTEIWTLNDGTPQINSSRTINLNRDAVKLESVELTGLYRNVFNAWDPVLIFDGHGLSGWYEYAIVYTTSKVPAAHPGTSRLRLGQNVPGDP